MRIAILTDIHANREAFEAVLSDVAARKLDRIICLGDIVGYGPDPVWCVERVMRLVDEGAFCIKGNHDSAVGRSDEHLNVTALRAINWTRPLLSEDHKTFLAGLPMRHEEGELLCVHASANDPADWIYVTNESSAMGSFRVSEARVILVGHRHVPALYSCDMGGRVKGQRVVAGMAMPLIRSRRWLGVVGSVGQPRDGVAQANYAILDLAQNELSFRRVPYDVQRTVGKLRAAGLPESLAMRLNWGT
ncbi:metallophosphoesterase family protein [Paragemmobacter straminiformis]|uniref:Metallophosphoesterase n=1 Tax=Paragemmobacter straminiformis TaxID=2045119 RepID=A0A842I6J7_9RHOB|nr:metallophosphoesterase family protein [Gemmobacter straminiformis]MBC2835033.1 metallophosphoesterase [Gemmobacter straminiformis]